MRRFDSNHAARLAAYWTVGHPSVVVERPEAIGRASRSLVLFLEHVPQTLGAWLSEHREDAAPAGAGSPYPGVEDALAWGTAFMSSRGLVHFDAHFHNLLTDGRLIYFADFGLDLSSGFKLSATEEQSLSDHLAYDRHYTASHLLHHLVDRLRGDTERDVFLQEWSSGRRPRGVPPEDAAIIERHARTTVVLDDFHRRLLTESKQTPFPTTELVHVAATEAAHGRGTRPPLLGMRRSGIETDRSR